MSSRPQPSHQPTSQTLAPENESGSKTDDASAEATSHSTHSADILLLVSIFVMLTWPWVFFGVVWALKGIRANNHLAKVITDHPHATNYFVTLIGSIVSMIISSLFSLVIIRFAQEWVTHHTPTKVFHVTVLSAFRHQHWPWGTKVKDAKHLLKRNRWWAAALVGACIGTFTFVTSSITSLLAPVPFNRAAHLTGTELDFSSTALDCLDWFDVNPISNNCDWQPYKGLEYTSCLGENQMVDVLESGRGNILSLLSNNSQSLTFSQLGNEDGLHFLGSMRGVLPIGPNGVPAFDTLQASPLSNPNIRAAMLSYNYTLEHQGLTSNVSCIYDTQSPIEYAPLVPNTTLALQYYSPCNGLAEVLTNVTFLPAVNSENILLFWACQSLPDAAKVPSYFVYLRGLNYYESGIGNITCTVSPIEPAIFPVTYQSIPGIFSSNDPIATSSNTNTVLIEQALVGLSGVMKDAQNWDANQVAESVITFGVKSFGLQPYVQTPEYLRLYEAMIQGILDYEATYIRLIYSTVPNPPSSCVRTVDGSVIYEVIGWSVAPEHIGYLTPMTIINLASLILLIIALRMAKKGGNRFDPTDPRPLIYAKHSAHETVPDEWKDTVTFNPKKLLRANTTDIITQNAVQVGEGVGESAANDVASEIISDTSKV